MVHLIFLIFPGVLAFTILYGEKRDLDEVMHKNNTSTIFKMIKHLLIMIFMVNLVGLSLGKIIFGAKETFVSGELHPHLLSLGYLLLVFMVSLLLGKSAKFYKAHMRIFLSREKLGRGRDET